MMYHDVPNGSSDFTWVHGFESWGIPNGMMIPVKSNIPNFLTVNESFFIPCPDHFPNHFPIIILSFSIIILSFSIIVHLFSSVFHHVPIIFHHLPMIFHNFPSVFMVQSSDSHGPRGRFGLRGSLFLRQVSAGEGDHLDHLALVTNEPEVRSWMEWSHENLIPWRIRMVYTQWLGINL